MSDRIREERASAADAEAAEARRVSNRIAAMNVVEDPPRQCRGPTRTGERRRRARARPVGRPRDLDQPYGVRALPTLILVGADGKIAGRFSGNEEDLDKILEGIFKN